MRLEELKARYAKMNESEKVGEGQKAFNRLANEMIRFGYRRQEAVSFGCLLVRLAAGSDKYASEEEYNLFKDSTGVELTLEEFKDMVKGAGKDDFVKVIDEIVDSLDRKAKDAALEFVALFLVSDADLDAKEKEVFKLLED